MLWIYITVLVVSVLKMHGDKLLKLTGGRTEHEGNIAICINTLCMMECDNDFEHVKAVLICRMLGYQRGIAITNGPFFDDEINTKRIRKMYSRCNGTEVTLFNCKINLWRQNSPCHHNAGVICDEPDIQVKLIGGRTEREGNIDIFIAGRWGMLCDKDLGHVQAVVICRMLGYQGGIVITNGPFFDDERSTTWIWEIISRCTGTEVTLSNCILRVLRQKLPCQHYAGVICDEPDIQVKLVGVPKQNEGNIEIFIAGTWGPFCDQHFYHTHADVICRMLGHQRGIAITNGPFLARQNTTYIWEITSRCNGTEATISDCKLKVFRNSPPCIYNAGVICGEPDIHVKLIGGRTKREGNIDISIADRWGRLCDNWYHVEAVVICRMLGYQGGIAITNGPVLDTWNTNGNWQITGCNGTEATLSNCKLNVLWQPSSCINNAGVICGEPDLHVRLVGGRNQNEGNIDILIAGRWGRFCTQRYDHIHAVVICRMLGHQRGIAITNGPFLDESNITSHWEIIARCGGIEAAISDCQPRFWWQLSSCTFNTGVICGKPDIFSDIRLVGGNYENEGRVELNINGRWGTMCADLFDIKDAKVLCRFLSQPQSLVLVANNEHFGKGNATIEWKIQPKCHGNETSLSECQLGVVSINAECSQPQAGVICGDKPEVPDHGIGIPELIGGLLGVVSVAALAFGVFIYCQKLRRVGESSSGADAQTIQEPRRRPIPRPRPRSRRMSSHYDDIADADVLVNDYDTIGNPDAVYLELIDHYDQLESPDELSIADPNDGYLHPNVHGIGGEVTESGDGDEDNHPNDGYLHPIVHGTGGESCEVTGSDRDEDNHPNDGYLQPIVDGTGGEVTESGVGDEDSPPNDVCSNDDGLMEMDIETTV